jgi:hypothetical protein
MHIVLLQNQNWIALLRIQRNCIYCRELDVYIRPISCSQIAMNITRTMKMGIETDAAIMYLTGTEIDVV